MSTPQSPNYTEVQDATLTLSVHRPQTNTEWITWHANRDRARRFIDRIRVVDRERDQIDEADTTVAQQTILQALGLDPDSEAKLLTRWT